MTVLSKTRRHLSHLPTSLPRPKTPIAEEMLPANSASHRAAAKFLRQTGLGNIAEQVTATWSPFDFGAYMAGVGVGRHFSVKEVCEPNDAAAAATTGYEWLVPPAATWNIVAVLLWIADEMRSLVDAPVNMRSLWRPMSYNRLVAKSGIESDHPNACGMDLDFKSSDDREKAMHWLCGLISSHPSLKISAGIGKNTIHVGVLSPEGRRHWTYKSLKDGKVPYPIKS